MAQFLLELEKEKVKNKKLENQIKKNFSVLTKYKTIKLKKEKYKLLLINL
jgi:hypothetical protein